MNCIIVDDEPLARDVLENYIRKVPFLELKASCKNAFEAIEVLKKVQVDLIFLDIQMPDLSGIQFYQSLQTKPQVIFTTAYSNYAVEGFEVAATDYLVKPFGFDRFMRAVVKASEAGNIQQTVSDTSEKPKQKEFIFVKDGTKTVKLWLSEILFLEGMKDYIKIHLNKGSLLTLMSMQAMMELLPQDQFIRVHRSYIVSFANIDSIERNRIVIGDDWIPIGNMYKEDFFRKINKPF